MGVGDATNAAVSVSRRTVLPRLSSLDKLSGETRAVNKGFGETHESIRLQERTLWSSQLAKDVSLPPSYCVIGTSFLTLIGKAHDIEQRQASDAASRRSLCP